MLKNQTYLPYPNISLFIIYLLYIKKLEGQNHASIKDIKESNNSTQMSFQQRGIAIRCNNSWSTYSPSDQTPCYHTLFP